MLNRRLYYNLLLAFLSPLLFLSMMLWGVTAWFVLVPSLLLFFEEKFKQAFYLALIPTILVPTITAFFLTKFDIIYFFYFILYYGSFFILFHLLVCLSFNKIKQPFALLAPSVIWLALIPIYSLVPGKIYWWFNIGGMQPLLFPLNYYIGSYAITFFIVFVNTLIAFFFVNRKKSLLYIIGAFGLVILFCFASSYYLPADQGRKIKVAIVQGNFFQDWSWRMAHADSDVFATYQRLTLQAAEQKPDIVVWPEYAIPTDILLNKGMYKKISDLARQANVNLVFGTYVGLPKTDPIKNYEWDTAIVFSRQGEQIGRYDATVPFPYKNWTLGGNKLPIIVTDVGRIGIAMCYEELQPAVFDKYKKTGAQFFITLSNDSPINSLEGMKAKSLQVRSRAAENKLYLLRAANTGLTEVVNPYGKVTASIPPDESGVLITDIYIK